MRVASVNMELQPTAFRLKGGGGGYCPLKAHFIQGAVDLLGEMKWPLGQEGSARLLSTDASPPVEGARFNAEVNGGVPAHIDDSLDKRTQHERISNSNEFRVKSSSFITVVVANRDEMKDIKGAAVSANPRARTSSVTEFYPTYGEAGTSGTLVTNPKM
jgi:hypothetical protein